MESPSQILGHAAFRLALLKSIHKGLPCRDLTTRGSLGSLVSLLLVFVIGLSVWSQYILIQSICQAYFEKKYKLLSLDFLIIITRSLHARAAPCRLAAAVL